MAGAVLSGVLLLATGLNRFTLISSLATTLLTILSLILFRGRRAGVEGLLPLKKPRPIEKRVCLTLDLTPGFILVLMEGTIHIGEAGKLAGVSADAIRFYQRQGLIPATPRSAGGYRLFSKEQIRDLTFVKHAQELGFSLNEIKELLSLRQSRHVCPGVQSVLERKLQEVHEKMQRLATMKRELSRELRNCKRELRTKRSVRHEDCCPLIEKLEQEDGRHTKRSSSTRK